MGLFDSLTAAFTGQPTVDAAAKQRDYLTQQAALTNQRIQDAQATGIGALQSGQAGALGSIGGGVTQGRADISGAVDPALRALYGGQAAGANALLSGQSGGLAALQSGVDTASGLYGGTAAAYGGAADQARQAQLDALGLNGPEGYARAVSQFQAGPGYQFQLNQGVDAATRAANAAGGGNAFGGNLLRATQDYGSNLANQTYQQYLTNLQGVQNLYAPLQEQATAGGANAALTGGTGAANILTGTGKSLADLYSSTGGTGANIYTGAAKDLANLAYGGGVAGGNVYTGTGQNIANLVSGLSGQQTSYTGNQLDDFNNTYSAAANAQQGGSANLWNLALGGAKLAAGGLGYLNPSVGASSVRT